MPRPAAPLRARWRTGQHHPGVGSVSPNSPALAAMSIKQQVDTYLAQKIGVADPSAFTQFMAAPTTFLPGQLPEHRTEQSISRTSIDCTNHRAGKTIMQQIATGALSPTDGSKAALAQSTADLRDQVARLQAAGAKYVMVPLLPTWAKHQSA